MDPINTTPTEPNVNPTPDAAAPVSAMPTASEPTPGPEVAPASSPSAAVVPEAPVASSAPVASEPSTAPVNADVANAALNPPVNPVVTPSSPTNEPTPAATPGMTSPATTPGAMNPGIAAQGIAPMPMNQMFQSQPAAGQANVIAETTAIAVPEGPKAPDPVEEELKAPLKAAAPAPGSIGSAVSGPASQNPSQPQNVSFADPANNPMTANQNMAPAGKKPSIFDKITAKTKMTKSTLILLSIVAGLIVVALIVVLVLVATGNL